MSIWLGPVKPLKEWIHHLSLQCDLQKTLRSVSISTDMSMICSAEGNFFKVYKAPMLLAGLSELKSVTFFGSSFSNFKAWGTETYSFFFENGTIWLISLSIVSDLPQLFNVKSEAYVFRYTYYTGIYIYINTYEYTQYLYVYSIHIHIYIIRYTL